MHDGDAALLSQLRRFVYLGPIYVDLVVRLANFMACPDISSLDSRRGTSALIRAKLLACE